MFDNLSRLKLLLVYLQCLLIHYFDDCCLFIERLSRCWSCLVLVFGCILVALLRVQYQICKCFFFCFCLGYIHFGNMFGTVYYFLVFRSLTPACFGLLTDNQFSLNHCFFLENSCINLSSLV